MIVIGLTGGIATGKSTVSRHLKELGAVVIDADELARAVVEPGQPALAEIRRVFGDGVITPDGALDRRKMADIIFSSPTQRKKLEAIIHPRVRARMSASVARLRETGEKRIVVCDIPLLYETGVAIDFIDRVLVVYTHPRIQKERLMQRNGFSEQEAEARLRAQWPIERKAKLADDVIDNSGTLQETLEQVRRLWRQWQRLCTDRSSF